MYIAWLKSLSFHVRPKTIIHKSFCYLDFHYQFGITMAAFGGYGNAETPNPFAIPVTPNPMNVYSDRQE